MNEKMLKLRKEIKAKKPDFKRQDSHKKARVSSNWRRPKGSDSKIRQGKKGYRKAVAAGYGSPAEVRGLSREGFIPVIVNNVPDLRKIKYEEAAVISKNVGQRKKISILKMAEQLGIMVINVRDAKEYLKAVNEKMQRKKEGKEKSMKDKEKKKAEKEKKAEEKKEDLAEKLTDEEKKAEEKKEREKVLIKKAK